MERRIFLSTLAAVAVPLLIPTRASAQDVEFLAAVARAQRSRPAAIGSSARIAGSAEPGVPLMIHGRAFQVDGATPALDLVIFAYHTDATGRYDSVSAGPHSWRLRGWVKTDADGRFEFASIRPAPYPNRRAAAHVHMMIERPAGEWQSTGILFEGDPLISDVEREEARRAGQFGQIRPVEVRGGVEHVNVALRLSR
jgi:protocatechuate 3,4-dioxygenase beta subunit